MTLTDLIEKANSVIALPIDWENITEDENYITLFECARIRLHDMLGNWLEGDSVIDDAYKEVALYGIIAEYAFISGLYDMWKEYETKYNAAIRGCYNGLI